MKSIAKINNDADLIDFDNIDKAEMPPILEMAQTVLAVWPTIKAILQFAKIFTGKKADSAIDYFILRMEGVKE